MSKRKTARPANDAPAENPTVTVAASRCPSCGSTDRMPYFATKCMSFSGIGADGELYTHVVWRRTRCKNCGRCRIDKSFENRLPADCSGSEQIEPNRAA